jgi:hypothetical protein
MSNINEALEDCLNEIDHGTDIEKTLTYYPEYAAELRPLLYASIEFRQMSVGMPSITALRRNRARLLARAAKMHEEGASKPFGWYWRWRRTITAVTLSALIFASGTNLVLASSNTVPGDGLYSVKRSWENVVVVFTFNPQAKTNIQIQYEKERLDELNELFKQSRAATIDFSGRVLKQNGDGWRVANVLVIVSTETILPIQPVQIGAGVRVLGLTRGDGIVIANQIELLAANVPVPETETEQQSVAVMPAAHETETASSVGNESSPVVLNPISITQPNAMLSQGRDFDGTLNSIQGNVWVVDSQPVDVTDADIKGLPSVGVPATVKGDYDDHGVFVATTIELSTPNEQNNDSYQNQPHENYEPRDQHDQTEQHQPEPQQTEDPSSTP